MFAKLINGFLDRIEDFGYALAGLPPINRKERSMDHEAEEWRDAIDYDHPDDYPDTDLDEEYDLDLEGYYEGDYSDYYDDEDYV